SSATTRRETVAWLSPRRLAAPRICPARATARKIRTSSQFIGSPRLLISARPFLNVLYFLHNGFDFPRVAIVGSKRDNRPTSKSGETPMEEIGHFIGGKRVEGRSGR